MHLNHATVEMRQPVEILLCRHTVYLWSISKVYLVYSDAALFIMTAN